MGFLRSSSRELEDFDTILLCGSHSIKNNLFLTIKMFYDVPLCPVSGAAKKKKSRVYVLNLRA